MAADRRIYLDHNATTPMHPEVVEAVRPWLGAAWGNASSVHYAGRAARAAVDEARAELARFLNAQPSEIVFTASGSEADNLAIVGAVRAARRARPDRAVHVVLSAIEHPAVLRACESLEHEGARLTRIAPTRDGTIDAQTFIAAYEPDTVLASLMLANNETGALQPVREVAHAARARGILVHSDAVQAAGRVPLDVSELGVDLLALSGHKFGAMQGAGVLYVRRNVALEPLVVGGGQERGRRAGTENVAGAVSLGAAARVAARDLASATARTLRMRDRLEAAFVGAIDGVSVHSASVPRLCNTTSIHFEGVDGEGLLLSLDLEGIAASSGSACASGTRSPSHVLLAMGLSPDEAYATIRFSLSPATTDAELDFVIEAVPRLVRRVKSLGRAVSHRSRDRSRGPNVEPTH
jgi:cysteine desulfurase